MNDNRWSKKISETEGDFFTLAEENLSNEEIKQISEALKSNTSLTSINLWDVGIGNEGCRYLSEALKSNNTITSINLNGNNSIGDEGCRYFSEALNKNSTLTKLILGGDSISENSLREINQKLERNKNKEFKGNNNNKPTASPESEASNKRDN